MNRVQLYKNPYYYPYYSNSISAVGEPYDTTPRNMDLKQGFVDLQCSFTEATRANYMSISRENVVLYAWITNIEERGGNIRFRFYYEVDPLRTWLDKLNLGNQFVVRSPVPTNLFDPYLGSTQPYNDIIRTEYSIGNPNKRVLVVQVRRYSGESFSNVPVQPSINNFFVREYDVNNWTNDTAITTLLTALTGGQPDNIVTMYSVPYFDTSGLSSGILPVFRGGTSTDVTGFKFIQNTDSTVNRITTRVTLTIPPNLTKVKHSVLLVIPEAGIISIPDELLYVSGLALRQDVDIYSGAANYMLVDGNNKPFNLSVRGSSITSIPVISDPMETYISQNQNTLAVGMLGDVANILVGAGTALSTGGLGAVMGSGMVTKGISSLATTYAHINDARHQQSNPPAFLGTALVPHFNQRFWQLVIKTHVDNATTVNAELGYPCNMFKALTFPSNGFIQTQGCSVSSDGTVPLWAIQEINRLFDNGIRVI